MSSCCPICCNITTGTFPTNEKDEEIERVKLQERFFSLFQKYYNGGSHSGLQGESKLLHFPFQLEKLTAIGIFSCGQCMKLIESFCELHHQLNTIQLYLNWKVEVLISVMKSAQGLPSRTTGFLNFIRKANLENGKLVIGDEQIQDITRWRDCAIEKFGQKLKNGFPKLPITKWKPTEVGHDTVPNIQSEDMDDEDFENLEVGDNVYEDPDVNSGSDSDSSSATAAPAKLGSKINCKVANCKSIFYNTDEYEKHQKFHGQFPCTFCDAIQTSAVELAWHEISEHSSDPSILQRKKRKLYSCPRSNCSYSSSFRKLYIRHHLQKHLQLNPNELTHTTTCDICGATFTSTEHRKLPGRLRDHHENTHNLKNLKEGDTPFGCDHGDGNCTAYFLSLVQLSAHKRNYHEIKTNITCPICNALFGDEESLRKHKWEHRLEGLRMGEDKNNLIEEEDMRPNPNLESKNNHILTNPELLPTVMESKEVEHSENENAVKVDVQNSDRHSDSSSESDNYYNELDDVDNPFVEPTAEEFMDWESQEVKIRPCLPSSSAAPTLNRTITEPDNDAEGASLSKIESVNVKSNADLNPSQSILAEDVGGGEGRTGSPAKMKITEIDTKQILNLHEVPQETNSSRLRKRPVHPCLKCLRTFSSAGTLEEHQRSHSHDNYQASLTAPPSSTVEKDGDDIDNSEVNSGSDSDSSSSSVTSESPKLFSSKISCKVANCKSVFYNEDAYKNHQKFHGQFPCIFCNSVKISAEELAWHEISQHSNDPTKLHRKKKKLYACPRPNCSYSSTFKKHYIRHHLQQHLKLNPNELTHTTTCDICGAIFTSAAHRKLPGYLRDHHEKAHNLENLKKRDTPFKCDQDGCTAYFLLSLQLSLHKRNIHQIKSYLTCSDCNKGFKDHEKLRKHKENHHAEVLIHPCTIPGCTYSSETKNGLEIHIRVRHEQLDKSDPLKCPECDKSFISKSGLLSHMKMHSLNSNEGMRTRICEKCGKIFKSKDKLRQHYLSHSGPGSWRFQCDLCSKKCINQTKLEEHMRTHTQDKPFVCEICGAKYAHAHNLRIHVNSKHGKQVNIK